MCKGPEVERKVTCSRNGKTVAPRKQKCDTGGIQNEYEGGHHLGIL